MVGFEDVLGGCLNCGFDVLLIMVYCKFNDVEDFWKCGVVFGDY